MTEDEKFKLIKQKIIEYDFYAKKIVCTWKKINKEVYIIKDKMYYNSQNPYECIFVNDYQDRLWKCFHMLEILYIDYIVGEPLKEDNYLMSDEDAIQYIKKRYQEFENV